VILKCQTIFVRYQVLNSLPEVTITNTDRQRLVSMATAALRSQRDGVAASMLLGEIARATVVLPGPLPPNAIVKNCDVEVRDNIKKAIKHLGICPSWRGRPWSTRSIAVDAHRRGACLPSEGASIKWCTPVGDRSSYRVLRVRHRALKNRTDQWSKDQHEKVDEHAGASCVHWA
jgi:hypothetical protein